MNYYDIRVESLGILSNWNLLHVVGNFINNKRSRYCMVMRLKCRVYQVLNATASRHGGVYHPSVITLRLQQHTLQPTTQPIELIEGDLTVTT